MATLDMLMLQIYTFHWKQCTITDVLQERTLFTGFSARVSCFAFSTVAVLDSTLSSFTKSKVHHEKQDGTAEDLMLYLPINVSKFRTSGLFVWKL